MPKNNELSELLQSEVSVNGELHLNKKLTALTIQWVLSMEKTMDEMFSQVVEIQDALKIKREGDV